MADGGEDAAAQIISAFTAELVAGMSLPLRRSGGRLDRCQLQADEAVTTLYVTFGSRSLQAPLDDVSQITIGEEVPEGVDIRAGGLCVTLAFWSSEAWTFELRDVEARDTFALVLGMFVDQRRQYAEDEGWEDDGQGWEEAGDDRWAAAAVPAAGGGTGWSAPAAAAPGAPGHDYQTEDFWKPTWCDECKVFLQGFKSQGRTCRACRRSVCHGCAALGGGCPAAAGGRGATATAGPSGTGAPAAPAPRAAPAADSWQHSHRDGGGSTARSSGGSSTRRSGDEALDGGKLLVKRFVQEMVKGRTLEMLSKVGGRVQCLVHLDRDLKTLYLQRADRKDAKKRGISLSSVQEICVGTKVSGDVELPVDDHTVTVLLEEGQAVAFQLRDVEDRDSFALCLGMLVDGNRKEAHRKTKQR